VTTKPTLAKGMRVSSTIITGIENEWDTKAKDEESWDLWCETPKSKTYLEYGIPEELWGNWPTKEKTNIACDYKERNFWNCSAKVLGSVKELDETTATILWCGGL
jgi:hypothetical protein